MNNSELPLRERVVRLCHLVGFPVLEPIVRLAALDEPWKQLRLIAQFICLPMLTFAMFLGLWSAVAKNIKTNYGTVPTPGETWVQAIVLLGNFTENWRLSAEFRADQRARARSLLAQAIGLENSAAAGVEPAAGVARSNAQKLRERARAVVEQRFKAASRSYFEQIGTSLFTVFAGFSMASIIAIPAGIACGLSKTMMASLNPLIQIFKPVSPLAWLPIVMIVVGALHPGGDLLDWLMPKSFVSSALTVALCSMWPTLVNTALGVGTIEKDYMNVAKVLRLSPWRKLRDIILPASLPLMFTGLRISLGVGWMVLIAAEMLAQNPGLGKFVWDMFQNGSSETLAKIIVAVFTVGIIGFMLDRIMIILQKVVSFDSIVSA